MSAPPEAVAERPQTDHCASAPPEVITEPASEDISLSPPLAGSPFFDHELASSPIGIDSPNSSYFSSMSPQASLAPLAQSPASLSTSLESSQSAPLSPSIPSLLSNPQTSNTLPESGCVNITDCDDIGLILRSFPQNHIRNLPPNSKYLIFANHFKPTKFPSRYFDGCNRSCQHKYLIENPWFVYSKVEDGIFCLPCVLFAAKDNLGQFVCRKFDAWSKKTMKFADHNSKQYHLTALTMMDGLKSSITHPESSIRSLVQRSSESDIARNRFVIKCIAEAIHLCGKLCISLRGYRDDSTSDSESNMGNFLALLRYSIGALAEHLQSSSRNAVYTSKTIQNEIIECFKGRF